MILIRCLVLNLLIQTLLPAQPAIDSSDYFPLSSQFQWVYLSYEIPPYFFPDTSYISGTVMFNDTLYTVRTNTSDLTDYYRKDSSGNIYGRISDRDQLVYDFTRPLGTTILVRKQWVADQDTFKVSRVADSESVETMTGVFHRCKVFLIEAPGGSEMSCYLWFAPGLGIVKRGAFGGIAASLDLRACVFNGVSITPRVWQLYTVRPLPRAVDTSADSRIFFYFNSTPCDSVTQDQFSVRSQKTGIVPGNWAIDYWGCLFTPDHPFPRSDTITVTISAGLKDYFGDRLDGNFNWIDEGTPKDNYTWSFTTSSVNEIREPLSDIHDFLLCQNYPNPFNPTTKIEYEIPKLSRISITIVDVLGREVEMLFKGYQNPGKHETVWNAAEYPSGVYFCRFVAERYTQTRKLILLK